jgi:hypothetical protein
VKIKKTAVVISGSVNNQNLAFITQGVKILPIFVYGHISSYVADLHMQASGGRIYKNLHCCPTKYRTHGNIMLILSWHTRLNRRKYAPNKLRRCLFMMFSP